MKNNTKRSLDYIYQIKQGNINDLMKNISKKDFEELKILNLINIGVNDWRINENGKKIYRFANIEKEFKPTFFDKIQGYINGLIMDRKIFKIKI